MPCKLYSYRDSIQYLHSSNIACRYEAYLTSRQLLWQNKQLAEVVDVIAIDASIAAWAAKVDTSTTVALVAKVDTSATVAQVAAAAAEASTLAAIAAQVVGTLATVAAQVAITTWVVDTVAAQVAATAAYTSIILGLAAACVAIAGTSVAAEVTTAAYFARACLLKE